MGSNKFLKIKDKLLENTAGTEIFDQPCSEVQKGGSKKTCKLPCASRDTSFCGLSWDETDLTFSSILQSIKNQAKCIKMPPLTTAKIFKDCHKGDDNTDTLVNSLPTAQFMDLPTAAGRIQLGGAGVVSVKADVTGSVG